MRLAADDLIIPHFVLEFMQTAVVKTEAELIIASFPKLLATVVEGISDQITGTDRWTGFQK